ncbi:B4GALT2 [Branchiostoma lanceolatum]|uniref:Beta-1,4-galactosyltransferase n=1 Tax=Branchiostoma lanceolatum TaxID=7740 RepID=A0A8K0ERC7_BRALA|nr:B4GALT2 [Branchiostoma lanceolatum]
MFKAEHNQLEGQISSSQLIINKRIEVSSAFILGTRRKGTFVNMRKRRLCRLILLQVICTIGLITYLHLVDTSRERETLQNVLRDDNPYGNVRFGGKWSPSEENRCGCSEKVAILVPYRDREEHLDIFLRHMHPFLQRHRLDYVIYVIEQHGEERNFCKGLLYNVGFTEALKDDPTYDCFIFHDVDLLPEDSRNLYTCSKSPCHLSVAIDKFDYNLPYNDLFGGVSAMKTSHYKLVNGYSNLFCGWGGEDDDIARRLKRHMLKISRPDKNVARYKMLSHNQTEKNPQRFKLLGHWLSRAMKDGLKSLKTTGYNVTSTSQRELYTHILVNITKRGVIDYHHKKAI